MKTFLVRESSSGDLYVVKAADAESVYRKFGKQILGMQGDFDTGNVDIDLAEIRPAEDVKEVKFSGEAG